MTQGDPETSGNSEAVNDVLQALAKYESDGTLMLNDAAILKNVLGSNQIKSLINIFDRLNSIQALTGYKHDYIRLLIDVMVALERDQDERCKELFNILNNPFFRGLIDAHDNIVNERYKMEQTLLPAEDLSNADDMGPPIRVVGLTKSSNEPLGVTFGKHLDNCIYIRRILPGTMVEKQGLLTVGDIIREINGEKVSGDPAAIEEKLKLRHGDVTIKVIPAFKDTQGNCHVFLRCHFDYDPTSDDQFPGDEIGLSFQKQDIIEVIDQSDPKWWQATHVGQCERTGLIPSLKYEQMRRACSTSLMGAFKGKKKISYRTSEHALFDCLDTQFYEEVTKMPAMERKVIVLVGAAGVGRRTIKRKFIENYPDRYTTILPDTSRAPRAEEVSGRGYHFIAKDKMMEDIAQGMYVEWGEYNGNYYGTRLDAIRDVMNAGKICIVDCNPSALKILKTAEFMPLIVFIDAPNITKLTGLNERKESFQKAKTQQQLEATITESAFIKNQYHHYFDVEIVNEDFDTSYDKLKVYIEGCMLEPQWVPVSWVY